MPEQKVTKVGFVSLGCPKNLVDSEVMLGTLSQRGYSITTQKEDADVIVVNTCGFIDSAKKESIDAILEMAQLKERGNCKKLVVAGCLAERYRTEIRKEIPEIDFIFGPDELGRILEAVQLDSSAAAPDVSIDALYTSREVPTIPRILTTPSYMAYLKISEGCDHVCTFCAIPGFRGRFRIDRGDRAMMELSRAARARLVPRSRQPLLAGQVSASNRRLGDERQPDQMLPGEKRRKTARPDRRRAKMAESGARKPYNRASSAIAQATRPRAEPSRS